MERRLEIGCGPSPRSGYEHNDINPGPDIEHVGPIHDLDFPDGAFVEIFGTGAIEHLTYEDELPRFLREVRRVLGEFGQLCVVGPDYNRATTNPAWFEMIPQIMHGDEEHPGNQHRWISTAWKNLLAVREVFPAAREIDIRAASVFWPIFDRVGWQFAILTEV